MLSELAETQAPPQRVDIDQAMHRGRRNRRWRQAGIGGSAMAFAITAGAVLATAPHPHTTAPAVTNPDVLIAPDHFNPLVQYASFGWLPAGFSASGPSAQGASDTIFLYLNADSASRDSSLSLTVYPRGACIESPAGLLPELRCRNVFAATPSGGYGSPDFMTSRALLIDGKQAFWGPGLGSNTRLWWEYAPDAWSELDVGRGELPVLRVLPKVAASVRYGETTPLHFPFWITSIPRGWKVWSTFFQEQARVALSQGLVLGPAANQGAVVIGVSPASPQNSRECISPGQSHYVTLDGTRAVVWLHPDQDLCDPDVDGLQLDTRISGHLQPPLSDAFFDAKALHLLGADPAHWTTDPIR
jgi:hypothetical protein